MQTSIVNMLIRNPVSKIYEKTKKSKESQNKRNAKARLKNLLLVPRVSVSVHLVFRAGRIYNSHFYFSYPIYRKNEK